MIVTRTLCRNCGATLEGRFTMGRLFQLTPEQLHFVEVFLRCEGKIGRVEEELGVSYPTVRGRLNDIVRTLGYDTGSETESADDRRKNILEQLARKEISAEEAFARLEHV
jgi:hypothetical protein